MRSLLEHTAAHAAAFVEGLDAVPVAAVAELPALRAALGGPVPETGPEAAQVIDELARA